jgi:hypothetical protein
MRGVQAMNWPEAFASATLLVVMGFIAWVLNR